MKDGQIKCIILSATWLIGAITRNHAIFQEGLLCLIWHQRLNEKFIKWQTSLCRWAKHYFIFDHILIISKETPPPPPTNIYFNITIIKRTVSISILFCNRDISFFISDCTVECWLWWHLSNSFIPWKQNVSIVKSNF